MEGKAWGRLQPSLRHLHSDNGGNKKKDHTRGIRMNERVQRETKLRQRPACRSGLPIEAKQEVMKEMEG